MEIEKPDRSRQLAAGHPGQPRMTEQHVGVRTRRLKVGKHASHVEQRIVHDGTFPVDERKPASSSLYQIGAVKVVVENCDGSLGRSGQLPGDYGLLQVLPGGNALVPRHAVQPFSVGTQRLQEIEAACGGRWNRMQLPQCVTEQGHTGVTGKVIVAPDSPLHELRDEPTIIGVRIHNPGCDAGAGSESLQGALGASIRCEPGIGRRTPAHHEMAGRRANGIASIEAAARQRDGCSLSRHEPGDVGER